VIKTGQFESVWERGKVTDGLAARWRDVGHTGTCSTPLNLLRRVLTASLKALALFGYCHSFPLIDHSLLDVDLVGTAYDT